jgi:endonuclease/exonuclease/phosphatase family metal-dependent hydrolase
MSPLTRAAERASSRAFGYEEGARLRILTYNVQAGIATQRFRQYVTRGWRHVLPHPGSLENLDRVASVVREFNVVGLQEVDAGSLRSGFVNQTEYLARRAGFPFWYHQTNRDLGRLGQHSNGLLTRTRPSAVVEHKLPGRIPGRGVLLVRFGRGDAALILLIVHLSLGRRARLEQIEYLRDLLAGYEHAIVMGDLNCTAKSDEMRRLVEGGALRAPVEDLKTFPSWRPSVGLDHILVTPSIRVSRAVALEHPYSDHLPVAFDVVLPRGVGPWHYRDPVAELGSLKLNQA